MKIRTQLFLTFLILGVGITIIISLIIFFQGKKIILNHIYSNLEAVSQTKEIRLNNMIEKNYEQFYLLAGSPALVGNLENYLLTKSNTSESNLNNVFKHYINILESYRAITILDTNGIAIISSDSTFARKNFSASESFRVIRKKGQYLDGFHYSNEKKLCFLGGVNIYNKKREVIGILLVELFASDIISLTNDYTGLGETGETVIAKKYGQSKLISPARFDSNAALKIIYPNNDDRYLMNLVLEQGKEGLFTDKLDYRGKKIIASARYIEEGKWGMITKMDYEEAYEGIFMLRNFLFALNIGFIFFAFISALLIGRYLAKPIEELIVSTEKIKQGQLETRAHISYNNELGALANSFNEMAEQLERKINELDKVGYVISHDLRAPLNNIIPLIDFIKEDNKDKLDKESLQMLDMIKNKSIQMNELITEILESAKGNKKAKETINTEALINDIINILNPVSHIQIFLQHNLPKVYYNKISLMQVFQNLIQNSIKYMDKPEGWIKIGSIDESSFHKFRIADNGPGIRADYIDKIFDMYETGGNTKDVEKTGIGLAVVKKIVEENGGKVWVESTEGEGCCFYFTIPKV